MFGYQWKKRKRKKKRVWLWWRWPTRYCCNDILYCQHKQARRFFFFFLLLFDYDCSEFRYSGDLIRIFNFSNSENRIYTWITDFELMANLRVFTSPVNAKYYSIISAGWPTRFWRICQFYRTNIMYPKNSIFVISYTK